MNREQAINYLICRGLTQEQVGDVVRALTYKPRDCANCKHYVVKDTRTNWGSQETTKIYGCECWECEYEPTTKNNLAGDIMDFPKTFDEFANFYGFKDKDEVYTNGSELIPVFRVKQWLEHISTTKNNLGVDCISREQAKVAIRDKFKDLPSRVEINTILNELPSVTPQEPRKGHWLRRPHVYGVTYCSVCDFELKIDNTNFCPNCGADMREVEE